MRKSYDLEFLIGISLLPVSLVAKKRSKSNLLRLHAEKPLKYSLKIRALSLFLSPPPLLRIALSFSFGEQMPLKSRDRFVSFGTTQPRVGTLLITIYDYYQLRFCLILVCFLSCIILILACTVTATGIADHQNGMAHGHDWVSAIIFLHEMPRLRDKQMEFLRKFKISNFLGIPSILSKSAEDFLSISLRFHSSRL